jgi:Tfp pilus assembly protein PilF
MKAGDFNTAAVHLEIAAGRLPRFDAAHIALAETYERLGRVPDVSRERAKISGGNTNY